MNDSPVPYSKLALYLAIFLLITVWSLVGCGNAAGPADTHVSITAIAPDSLVIPRAGARFVFRNVELDSAGREVLTADSVRVITAAALNTSYNGQQDVAVFCADNGDTNYMHYRHPADVATILPHSVTDVLTFSPAPVWLHIPVGGDYGQLQRLPDIDTVVQFLGKTLKVTATGTSLYMGPEDVAVGARTYHAHKVYVEVVATTVVSGQTLNLTKTGTLWFAPNLGFFVKQCIRTTGSTYKGFNPGHCTVSTLK